MYFAKAMLVTAALTVTATLSGVGAAAGSDGFCPTLTKLLDGAADGFAAVRGVAHKGAELSWSANFTLPGAENCIVFGGGVTAYTCTLYAGDEDGKAKLASSNAIARIAKCLPEWTAAKTEDGVHSLTTFTDGRTSSGKTSPGNTSPTIRVASRIGSANAYTVDLWIDAARAR